MQRPLCLPVNTAWQWLEKATTESGCLGDDAQQLQAREAAQKTYTGDGTFVSGEGQDTYLARCFPELSSEYWEEIEAWAVQLLLPLRQHLQEAEA